ncbi:M20/M25/M40 family metallo-hydrolase [Kribbella sp. NPDC058693]|uniref:M20/M25/M40 family metallo-hydrolase n=1 Tax=Kribbella sp. NPDC058693 TaxID=3346602 RepID=UPI003662CA71
MNRDDVRSKVAGMMPELLADLEGFTKLASIAFPGYPPEPVHEMAAKTVEVMRAAGFRNAALQEVPDGYPPVYATVDGPEGSPTVMLYAHYDVQPAPPEQKWSSDPWTPTRKDDGRLYGRGISDDKSGLVIHAGTLKAFDGTPPCHVKLIVEGMEETNSNLEAFVAAHPDLFQCDVFVVADMGNLKVGEPTLTTTLRGDVACVVTVQTLEHSLHSGVFGGPVPDAMMALAQLLATLHDADGNVAVEGVSGFDWDGLDFSEADLRAGADLVDGVGMIGTGTIGSRLWSRPSINVIGLDMTSVDGSSNVLIPEVRAKLSMRIVPGSSPKSELDALVRHLESHAPWGAKVTVERTKEAAPFRAATDGPGYAAARQALADAYGSPAGEAGSGGSIPLLQTLQQAAPNAEFILWGAEDTAQARIHASDESVDPSEIEAMTLAQVFLLQDLAEMKQGGQS